MIGRLALGLVLALVCTLARASPLGPDGVAGRTFPGKFIWFDLATEDPAATRAFYGTVFGWQFRTIDGAPASYAIIEEDGVKVGGMFRHKRPDGATVGARWLALISVADPAKAAQYVEQHGGKVVLAPRAVPGRGTHAVFRDPQGAVFGVLATGEGDPPDDAVTDGEIFWLDLLTPDPAAAERFYAGLANYEVSESQTRSGHVRRILVAEGIARAGIVGLPPGKVGPGWLPYILVDDVALTVRDVRNAGGKIVVEPRPDLLDGNLAIIADPLGGVVGVVNWELRVDARGPAR